MSSSIRPGGCCPIWRRWPPAGNAGWAPTRTPTGGCCCATCGCRTSAPTRWRSPRLARCRPKTPACSARFCATSSRSTTRRATSGSSARTKPCRTCWVRSLKSPTGNGRPGPSTTTSSWLPRAGCLTRCSVSTKARVGWKVICSPVGTACSTATKRSSTSSTRCSTSTPNGSRSPRNCPGAVTSRR